VASPPLVCVLLASTVLVSMLLASGLLVGCTALQAVPRGVWLLQEGTPRLAVKSLQAEVTAGNLRLVWTLAPATAQDLTLFEEGRTVVVTLVAAAEANPNWKPFEVRDGDALVNYLVRPEDDYLKTGGSLDRPAIDAIRRKLGTTGPVHLVTFEYPLRLGVTREPGDLSVKHLLGPFETTAVRQSFRAGCDAQYGTLPAARLGPGVTPGTAGAPREYVFVTTGSTWGSRAAVVAAILVVALIIIPAIRRRRKG